MKTTLDEMQTFIAVVEAGSLTAAADRLGQAVSAISRHLARLEDKLQTTLLSRTTRRLALTDEGQAYLARVRQIVAAVEATEEDMAARRHAPAGPLRVDAATPFMLHVVVPLLAGYHAHYPHVALELVSNEGITDLLERRTDVAIRIGALRDSTLHAAPIATSRLRVLAAPAYLEARGQPRTVDGLARHALLGFTQPESLNEWPLHTTDGQPLHVRPTMRAASGETLRQLALHGQGIVCLSDFMTQADRREGRLRPVLARQTLLVRQPIHAVYYRNTALSARIASFVNYLKTALGPAGFEE